MVPGKFKEASLVFISQDNKEPTECTEQGKEFQNFGPAISKNAWEPDTVLVQGTARVKASIDQDATFAV